MVTSGNGNRGWPGEEELAFDDGDDSLPWLESEDEEEPARFDMARVLGIGLLALVLLGAAAGAIWWLTSSDAAGGPEPDGSVIAAPEEPYRVPPANEGGKTFPGTGDTSFAVGEGQTREGRLADTPIREPSGPSLDTLTTPGAAPAPTPTRTQDERLPTGTAVQVGAYSNRADAQTGWQTLMRQTSLLNGVKYRIIRGQADIGTVYRLQAAAGSQDNARRLCRELQAAGLACTVK